MDIRMMRSRMLVVSTLVAVLVTRLSAAAQERVELDELKTPTAPAFVLLGITPTAVERPTTPRAFALSMLSAERSGFVPENYATEFAPYWMASHPHLTFDDFYKPTLAQRLRQSFSVSLASTTVMAGADSTPAIGIGFRIAPFVGGPTRRLDSMVTELPEVLTELTRLDFRLTTATKADSPAIMRDIQTKSATAQNLSDSIRAALESDAERVGFRLQFAGGLAGFYPGNEFSGGKIGRTGIWATMGYRLERPSLDVIALARFLANEEGTEQNALDLGARAVFLRNRFAGSVEWVARSVSEEGGVGPGGEPAMDSGNRVVGMLEYQANNDLFLSFSFGQDHPRAGEDGQPLIAILGGQLNFGPKPTVPIIRTPAP